MAVRLGHKQLTNNLKTAEHQHERPLTQFQPIPTNLLVFSAKDISTDQKYLYKIVETALTL